MYDHLGWAGIVPCTSTHARYYAKETFPVLLLVKFLHTDREILAAFTPTGNFSKANAHCTKCLVPQLGAVCAGINNMSKGVDFDTSAAEGKGWVGYVKAFFEVAKVVRAMHSRRYTQSTLVVVAHMPDATQSSSSLRLHAWFTLCTLHTPFAVTDSTKEGCHRIACLSSFLPSTRKQEKSHNNCYTTKDDLDHVSTFLIETASNIPTSCYLASSNHLWQRKTPNLRTWPHVLKASSSQVT